MISMMCLPLKMASMAVRGAFTAGAVAGTAGVIGLLALRNAIRTAKGSARADEPRNPSPGMV